MNDQPTHHRPGDLACNEVVEVVTDYLEGALPSGEALRVEEHLETCPGCTEYVAQMRTLPGSLGGLREESIPAQVRERLLASFHDLRRDA